MRRNRLAILALSGASCAFVACAAELPPPSPVLVLLPPPRMPPPAPAPLLVVPRAEASTLGAPETKTPEIAELRSEGRRYALQRTADGVVVISADRGVIGFVKSPSPAAPIRWAGFVDDDAILVVAGDTIHRAATPDDAIAGKLDAIGRLDADATMFASAGKIVVAAAPGPDGAYHESRDGGRRFQRGKRPGKGSIVALAVRSDGVIVAAIGEAPRKSVQATKNVRAQIVTAKRAGAWTPGPIAETAEGSSVLTHSGDSIVVTTPVNSKRDHEDTLGLDAKGRWIPTDSPDPWLAFAWTDDDVNIDAPTERPGFPGSAKGGANLLGGLSGRGTFVCHGASCLGQRAVLGSPPSAVAFHDGVCAREHITSHTETIPDFSPTGKVVPDLTYTTYDCDESEPARRASTLLVRDGAERRLARLPISCARGEITGSALASFVYCTDPHRGRPALLHVSPAGAITEALSGIPGNLAIVGAESASDGTTLIFATEAAWLCTVAGAPACRSVPYDHFLAGRPIPAGRALVARSSGDRELEIEVVGEPGARPLHIDVNDNVLEIELTAEGNIRLWTSPTLTTWSSAAATAKLAGHPTLDAFLVRADGQLVADPAAKEAWLRGPAAARAPG